METYVIGEVKSHSDMFRELMALEVLINKEEEELPDKKKKHKEATIDDFWFLGV
jgi:hypothetical protein